MKNPTEHKAVCKPRARLLELLGDQLIRHHRIALFELVKNAYDADSPGVIEFRRMLYMTGINHIKGSDIEEACIVSSHLGRRVELLWSSIYCQPIG